LKASLANIKNNIPEGTGEFTSILEGLNVPEDD